MTRAANGYVSVDGGRVYYEVSGDGAPIVFLHSGYVDSRMWDDQWEPLSRHHAVIRYDMRGFGRSDPVEAPLSRRRELSQVLAHLGVSRATLVGCSLGGETILDFALERPDTVASLVVVSATPGGFELQGQPPPDLLAMLAAVKAGDVARASELQVRLAVDGPFRQPDQADPLVRQRALEMSRNALAKETWGVMLAPPPDPLDPPAVQRLAAIQAPTLLVAGALDHPEILRAADVMKAAIPGAQVALIPGSGHLPNMERPAAFNRVVEDFLQRVS
jgi:pimeloyl-ACP methyl ester carboxylesterase